MYKYNILRFQNMYLFNYCIGIHFADIYFHESIVLAKLMKLNISWNQGFYSTTFCQIVLKIWECDGQMGILNDCQSVGTFEWGHLLWCIHNKPIFDILLDNCGLFKTAFKQKQIAIAIDIHIPDTHIDVTDALTIL